MIMMDSQIVLISARYRKEQQLKVGQRAALTSIQTDGLTSWMISYKMKLSGAMETATVRRQPIRYKSKMTAHSSLVTQHETVPDALTQMVTGTPTLIWLGLLLWVLMHL